MECTKHQVINVKRLEQEIRNNPSTEDSIYGLNQINLYSMIIKSRVSLAYANVASA